MLCFSMFCVSAGSKSNLAKAAGAEVALQRTQEKLHAAVARSTFKVLNLIRVIWKLILGYRNWQKTIVMIPMVMFPWPFRHLLFLNIIPWKTLDTHQPQHIPNIASVAGGAATGAPHEEG